jgi:hypothetical protein
MKAALEVLDLAERFGKTGLFLPGRRRGQTD